MLDLTGASLISYLRRVIEDIVNRNPRFRSSLGDVTYQFNNFIAWRDVQVVIRDVSTSGNRLSPDYFMCTQHGRALAAKIEGKDGSFIEWIKETDATRQTPPAGIYFLNVNSVDDETNEVKLTLQTHRWLEGKVANAEGSVLKLASNVDGNAVSVTDLDTSHTLHSGSDYTPFKDFLILLKPCGRLQLSNNGVTLQPITDYWYERKQDVALKSTAGGNELFNIEVPFIKVRFSDENGYELRPGLDYNQVNNTWFQLGEWTPAEAQLTAHLVVKVDPTTVSGTNSENVINLGSEAKSPQVFVHTSNGYYPSLTPDDAGRIVLPALLQPGQWATWEARVEAGMSELTAKKFDLNGDCIPGLYLAIGDSVVKGDQIAIIVTDDIQETYEVFGSKENLDFTLEVRSNDLQTSSDISEALKQQLLVMGRENMEADGITIFEARRSYQGQARDISGTTPTYSYNVSVSAAADWKVFMPLVTRMARFEVIDTPYISDYKGRLQVDVDGKLTPRIQALGRFGFLNSYS
jgi:hypothetical protein